MARKYAISPKSILLPKSIALLLKGLIMPNCINYQVIIQLLCQDKNLLNQKIPNKNAVIKKHADLTYETDILFKTIKIICFENDKQKK